MSRECLGPCKATHDLTCIVVDIANINLSLQTAVREYLAHAYRNLKMQHLCNCNGFILSDENLHALALWKKIPA